MQERNSFVQAGPAAYAAASSVGGHAASDELIRCLDELMGLPGADRETCAWLHDKLSGAIFNLVVAGQFKRGKSTLINALLGADLLPVGVVPLTSVVTLIRFDTTAGARIEFESGEAREVSVSALEDYVTERGNPRNAKGVRRALLRYPCAWLPHDVQLIDTPGIDSIHEHNTQVTQGFIPQADAVIFVASVEQPLGRAELEFLQSVRQYAGKLFCVLNKVDQLSPAELQESVAFSADCVQRALGAPARLYPVSARTALQVQSQHGAATQIAPGFQELKQALQAFMAADRNNVWRHSVAATLLRMLSQIRFTLELERSARSKPIEQLEAALGGLRLTKQEALRAQVEHAVLLQTHALALLHEQVEPELTRFKNAQQQRIVTRLDGWYRELHPPLSLRQLQLALEQRLGTEVRVMYDGWLAQQEPALAHHFDELCDRFWSQTQHATDDLMRRCGELFRLSFQPLATASVWRIESGFGYRFWSEPTSLRFLASWALLALPKRLAGALIVRRMRVRAQDLVETHAGRLRSDLEQRLQRSVADFRARLTAHMTDAIGRIEQAIARGIERRATGAAELSARAAALDRELERTARIEAQIRSLTP